MDVERIKLGTYLTEKYFEEQLERIREIRASERKFYQKVTDLYATAIDYDKTAAATKRFYATEDKVWAKQKIKELSSENPNSYYIIYSVPLDTDLTTLAHDPSIAITKRDLQ